jgi:3-oxoadipate enol-lactonase
LEEVNMPQSFDSSAPGIQSVRTGPRGGTPVVFVHALGLDLTYWDQQIGALCDEFDVMAFDLPGHGQSIGDPSGWTIEEATRVLATVIRSTGASNAHIVGLSVGSMIAQSLAVQEPSLVRSLTLIGSAATFAPEARAFLSSMVELTEKQGMQRIVESSMPYWFSERTKSRRPDVIDRTAKTLLRADPEVHTAMWRMVAIFDLAEKIHQITCPVLILVGDEDVSTPIASSEFIASLIAGSEMHVIEGGGHMLPLEAPSAVNEHLIRFLRTTSQV